MSKPTASQMAQLERIEADYRRAVAAGSKEMVLQVRRKPKPDATRMRIAPGLMGRLVQWGDGTWIMPSVVFVNTESVGRFIEQCHAQIHEAV